MSSSSICNACQAPNPAKKCPCGFAFYCSKQCQSQHRSGHKSLCRAALHVKDASCANDSPQETQLWAFGMLDEMGSAEEHMGPFDFQISNTESFNGDAHAKELYAKQRNAVAYKTLQDFINEEQWGVLAVALVNPLSAAQTFEHRLTLIEHDGELFALDSFHLAKTDKHPEIKVAPNVRHVNKVAFLKAWDTLFGEKVPTNGSLKWADVQAAYRMFVPSDACANLASRVEGKPLCFVCETYPL